MGFLVRSPDARHSQSPPAGWLVPPCLGASPWTWSRDGRAADAADTRDVMQAEPPPGHPLLPAANWRSVHAAAVAHNSCKICVLGGAPRSAYQDDRTFHFCTRNQSYNRSHSRQFVVTSVYQATQPGHLAVQLYHEHTNKHAGDLLMLL